jgi:hypothetical protein
MTTGIQLALASKLVKGKRHKPESFSNMFHGSDSRALHRSNESTDLGGLPLE